MQAGPAAPSPPRPLWRRWFVVVHLALALALTAHWLAAVASREVTTDFTVFHAAWSVIQQGDARSLYQAEAQGQAQRAAMGGRAFEGGVMAFLHPPHTAYLLAPLGRLPLVWAFRLWTLFQVVCLFVLMNTLTALSGARARLQASTEPWLWRLGVLAFWPVGYGLAIGQLSLPLACAAALLALWAHRPVHAGLALAVLCLKPQVALFPLLWLLALGRWRALGVAFVALGALCALASHGLGASVFGEYLAALPTLENHWGTGTPHFMHNLRAVLVRLSPVSLHALARPFAAVAWLVAAPVFVVWARRLHARGAPGAALHSLTVALLMGLWLSPHTFLQDLALLPVAAAAWIAHLRAGPPLASRNHIRGAVLFTLMPVLTIVSEIVDEESGRRLPTSLIGLALLVLTLVAVSPARAPQPASTPASPA